VQQVRGFFWPLCRSLQQAPEVALLDERRAEIRHDEVADEQHAEIRQVDEQPVVGLAALDRNQLDARATELSWVWRSTVASG